MARQTLSEVSWTNPELCHYNYDVTKPWFVYFDFTDHTLGAKVRKQYRNGLNYIKKKDERIKKGNALASLLKQKLESGWNPIRPTEDMPGDIPATIREAVDKVYRIKESSLKPKSQRNYRDISNSFLKWAARYGYDKSPLNKFSHTIAQAYMDYLLTERGYSGKSHNGQLGILKAFCSTMVSRWKIVLKENPFDGIVSLPEAVGSNIAYTKEEAQALLQYFKLRDKRLYYACSFMAHCYIRKTELTELKVGSINWDARTIIISSDSAKNRQQDSVTIPEALLPVLEEMKLKSYPADYYIFGHLMETTKEKISKPDILSNRHLIYIREIKQIHEDRPGKKIKPATWQFKYENPEAFETIAKITGDKTFYSWKHTGVVLYWHVIKDIYYMMRQLRHADMKTTMIYLKSLGLMPNEAFRNARVDILDCG